MYAKVIITVIYLAIVGYLGYLGFRNTKDSNDYLIGGRKIHPMVMALSYGATFISTSAIIGFGGISSIFGMSLLWLTFLNIILGVFIAFVFFGKRTRKMGHQLDAHTFPEFMGKRFDSAFIQKFSAIIIFLFMPMYTAAVMIGAATFLQSSLKIDYNVALFFFAVIIALYVFFGGLKGVMYSDAFQGALMFVGMLVLLISVYTGLGGISEAHGKLTEMMKNPLVLELIKAPPGFTGWTSMPTIFSNAWWVIVSSLVMGVGIGVLAQPQLVVRFMTVKSNRELNRAVPVGGIFIFMMAGVAYIVGPLSNVYFFEKVGKLSAEAAGGTDNVIPMFLDQFMPEWFVTIFLVIVVAAGMSTISSQFHTIGTSVGWDLFGQKAKNEEQTMLITRIGMLVAIIITVFLAYFMPKVWDGAIAISTGLFFGICAAAFLPMYIGAIYCKKMPKSAAIGGMLSGFATSILWMMFVHTKESSVIKISALLFHKQTIAPEGSLLGVVDPIIISLTVSIIVTVVITLVSKDTSIEEHAGRCFKGLNA